MVYEPHALFIVRRAVNQVVHLRGDPAMSDALDDQIEAYQALLPEIRRKHQSGWALVAKRRFIKLFGEFSEAAQYAQVHFGNEPVLIRHTDEKPETAPFVHIGI